MTWRIISRAVAPPDPITRRDFQQLARMQLRAARSLLNARQWQAAYHIAGFAVECALKACIAKRIRRYDFPPKETRDIYTHDVSKLVQVATLDLKSEVAASRAFETNWAIVKDWSPESRYDTTVSQQLARDLYRAITGRQNGVMRWIRGRW
jgi:HEPN domain-containing protein